MLSLDSNTTESITIFQVELFHLLLLLLLLLLINLHSRHEICEKFSNIEMIETNKLSNVSKSVILLSKFLRRYKRSKKVVIKGYY